MIIYSKGGQDRYKRDLSLPENHWRWLLLPVAVLAIVGIVIAVIVNIL